MTQDLYAHMNNKTIKRKEKKKNVYAISPVNLSFVSPIHTPQSQNLKG
jgi:hypothetical protein